jgi:hypothetical protein
VGFVDKQMTAQIRHGALHLATTLADDAHGCHYHIAALKIGLNLLRRVQAVFEYPNDRIRSSSPTTPNGRIGSRNSIVALRAPPPAAMATSPGRRGSPPERLAAWWSAVAARSGQAAQDGGEKCHRGALGGRPRDGRRGPGWRELARQSSHWAGY